MIRVTNTEFLRLFFGHAGAGSTPWVASFRSAPADATRSEWAGWAVFRQRDIPASAQRNNYVVISTFTVVGGVRKRRKANFAAMHCVMVDDIGPKVAERAIALPFTLAVETSPGNQQGWYRLEPPVSDRSLAERLLERMVVAGLTSDGRDPGMKGVTRYGRLPVGCNTKPAVIAANGAPWPHLVVEYRPVVTYTIDEIAEAYELDLTPPAPRVITVRDCSSKESATMLNWLKALGLYHEPLSEGWHSIRCPWAHQHTGQVDSGTAYREPCAENNWVGGFKCHHGHCEGYGMRELFLFIEAIEEQLEKGTT